MMKKFTLIELLIVVAIIGILVSILMPSLASAREKARIAVCSSNVSQNIRVMHLHAKDNNGKTWDSDRKDNYGLSINRFKSADKNYDMRRDMAPYLSSSGKNFNELITDDSNDIQTWNCPSTAAKNIDHKGNTRTWTYMNMTYFPGNRWPFAQLTHPNIDPSWSNLPLHVSELSNFVVQQDMYTKGFANMGYHFNHGNGKNIGFVKNGSELSNNPAYSSKTSSNYNNGSGAVLGYGDGSAGWKHRAVLQDVGQFHSSFSSRRLYSLPPRD